MERAHEVHPTSSLRQDITHFSHHEELTLEWWSEQRCELNQGVRWRIGAIGIELFRYRREWRLGWHNDPNQDRGQAGVESLSEGSGSPDQVQQRFVVNATSPQVELLPRCADRSVVIRPQEPFFLPSQQEATLYVSSPLWVEVMVDLPRWRLQEIPTLRPSDTWFGSTTMTGELAYASRTRGVLETAELQHRPHRIVTPLLIRNHADSALSLERVSLHAPFLSVYLSADGDLWTEAVTLFREEDGEMAELQISAGAPSQAKKAVKKGEPRQSAERNMLVRAFGGLFN